MLAAMIGGWELLLIAAVILTPVVLAGIGLAFYFAMRAKHPAPGPIPPAHPPSTVRLTRKCPDCGADLKADVPEGLCPACLLQHGIATEAGGGAGQPPFIPPTIAELAKLFPQLEILEPIGKGGMGAVYKARQPALDRLVALKILAPRPGNDLDFASRFSREARALARLSHPNIVGVYDFGQTNGLSYFIMEFVDGPNLRQVQRAGKLAPREALEIIPQICTALQFAHDAGIVHRDIKPENVLLDKKGRVKIADFGLAKIAGQEAKDFRLTGARDVMGTPHYMAPEQVEKPQEVDHRADIFSLGVVFYEMLTGELPLGKFAPPSHKVQVDVRLDEVVLRALEKEPARRYQQVSEVGTQVESIASTSSSGTGREGSAHSADREHQDRVGALKANTAPRFSRTAIAGLCMVLFSIPALFFGAKPLFGASKLFIFGFISLFLVLAFLSTILGWVGVVQIRRSAGHLYGMSLAVFDGLLFPLMALDALVLGFGFLVAHQIQRDSYLAAAAPAGGFTFGFIFALIVTVGFTILIDSLIVTRVWRAVNRPMENIPPVLKPDHFWRRFAIVIAAVLLIPMVIAVGGMLAAIAIPAFVKGHQRAQALQQGQAASGQAQLALESANQPIAVAETWAPQLTKGEKPDLQKIREEARDFMARGRYEEALQRQLWCFRHARELGESDTIRLSFGLSNWGELGRRYPKARQALIEIRDRDAREFAEGRGYADLFQEIGSLNRALQQEDATYALFKDLEQRDPSLARQCYLYVEDLLVAKGDYRLCARYLGDPPQRFEAIRRSYQMELESQKRLAEIRRSSMLQLEAMNRQRGWTNGAPAALETLAMMQRSTEDRFVAKVRLLIEILIATDQQPIAKRIQTQALATLDDEGIRAAVEDALHKTGKEKQAATASSMPPVPTGASLPTELPSSRLEFRWVVNTLENNSPADLLVDPEKKQMHVLKEVLLDERAVTSAGLSINEPDRKEIIIVLSDRGREQLAELTRTNVGRQLAIIWQGSLLSASVIRSAINSPNVAITGRFSDAECQKLIDALNRREQPALAVSRDLNARLEAAKSIFGFTEKDSALAAIARDASKAGDVEATRKALGQMTGFTARDDATRVAARGLAKNGHRPEAVEIARMITAFTTRDATLRELVGQ
jgi:predicted Ser/Thr protein kinase